MKHRFTKRLLALFLAFTFILTQASLPAGLFNINFSFLHAKAADEATFASTEYGYKLTYRITGSNTVALAGYDVDYADANPLTMPLYMADTNGAIQDENGTSYTVTAIDNAALKGMGQATSIHIPSTVKTIGDQAFQSCTNAHYFDFEGVSQCTSIGEQAFSQCSKLGSSLAGFSADSFPEKYDVKNDNTFYDLQLPAALTTLGAKAFDGCTSLQRVTFLGDSTVIGNEAFKDLGALSTVRLPKNAETIGESVFYNCISLKAANLPSKLTLIPIHLFDNTKLTTDSVDNYRAKEEDKTVADAEINDYVEFPSTVAKIEDYAFRKCQFTLFSMPDALTSIGISAFESCSQIYKITFNDKLQKINNSAFKGCSSLGAKLSGSVYQYYPVMPNNNLTYIGDDAFSGCGNLFNFRFGAGTLINHIGTGVFANTQLKTFSIPDTINYISDKLFQACPNLNMISVPRTLETIGESAFENDSTFAQFQVRSSAFIGDTDENIEVPADKDLSKTSITSIGKKAFTGTALVSFDLPKGVTTISESTFENCTKLTNFTFNEGSAITGINPNAFKGDVKLESFTLPAAATLDTLGNDIFSGCSALKSCTLNDKTLVTTIPTNMFLNCSSLTSFTLPSSITAIASNAFSGCSALTAVYNASKVTQIGDSAFLNCTSFKGFKETSSDDDSAALTVTVSSLGASAFSGCSSLLSITINGTLTTIPDSAFYNCTGVTELHLPASITTIQANAFNGCPLGTIYFKNLEKITMSSASKPCFTIDASTVKIHCYADMVSSLIESFSKIGITLSENRFTKEERPASKVEQTTNNSKSMYITQTWALKKNTDFKALSSDGSIASSDFSWFSSDPAIASVAVSDDNSTVTITAEDIGSATIVGTVDGAGSVTFTVNVKPNSSATIQNPYTNYTIYDVVENEGNMTSNGIVATCNSGTITQNPDYDASIYSDEKKLLYVVGTKVNEASATQDAFYWNSKSDNIKASAPADSASTTISLDGSSYVVGQYVELDPQELTAQSDTDTITLTTKKNYAAAISFKIKYKVDTLSYGNRVNVSSDGKGFVSINYDNTSTIDLASSSYLVVKSVNGTKKPAEHLTWTTDDPDEEIISVDENGVIKGTGNGTANVTVTSDDTNKSLTFTVTVVNAINSITIANPTEGQYACFPEESMEIPVSFDYLAANNSSTDELTYELSDSSIVQVTEFDVQKKFATVKIKGLKPGTTKLTIKSKSTRADGTTPNVNTSVNLKIKQNIEKIELNTTNPSAAQTQTLVVNKTLSLKGMLSITPSSGYNDVLTWSSTNEAVASVDTNGSVTAKSAGSANIHVTCERTGISYDFTINVINLANKAAATPERIGTKEEPFYVGDSVNVALSASSETGALSANGITWESSDPKVATVSNASLTGATITATGIGSTTISFLNENKAKVGSISVTVSDASIVLDKTSIQLYKKIKTRKSYTIVPEILGHSKDVTYTSSKPAVASVSASGKVTAKKKGNTVITITANGKTVTCNVSVDTKIKAKASVTCNNLTPKKKKITVKKKLKTVRISYNANWTVYKVTYKSSKKKVATIDEKGNIKLKKKGKTKITTSIDGIKKTFTLTVK